MVTQEHRSSQCSLSAESHLEHGSSHQGIKELNLWADPFQAHLLFLPQAQGICQGSIPYSFLERLVASLGVWVALPELDHKAPVFSISERTRMCLHGTLGDLQQSSHGRCTALVSVLCRSVQNNTLATCWTHCPSSGFWGWGGASHKATATRP